MSKASRRTFLKTSAVGVASIASTQAFAQNQDLSQKTIAEVKKIRGKRNCGNYRQLG